MALETDKTSAKQKPNQNTTKNESNKNSSASAKQVLSNNEPTINAKKKG